MERRDFIHGGAEGGQFVVRVATVNGFGFVAGQFHPQFLRHKLFDFALRPLPRLFCFGHKLVTIFQDSEFYLLGFQTQLRLCHRNFLRVI